jgi:hypothetical protein
MVALSASTFFTVDSTMTKRVSYASRAAAVPVDAAMSLLMVSAVPVDAAMSLLMVLTFTVIWRFIAMIWVSIV